MTINPLPTYFIAHGGVGVLDLPQKDPYRLQLLSIGDEIKSLNPKGIIATSGHFESPYQETIQVNIKEDLDVLYDYFFKHDDPKRYQLKFKHFGDKAIAGDVVSVLKDKGIPVETVEKDTDHGIWVALKLLFPEEQSELKIPVISVSTFKPSTFKKQVELGEALSSLRNEGFVLIHFGMPVHNIYVGDRNQSKRVVDSLRNDSYDPVIQITNPNYSEDFTKELEILNTIKDYEEKKKAVIRLENDKESNIYQAHPTLEHFTPFLAYIGSSLRSDSGYNYKRTKITSNMSFSNFKLESI
ncbi:2,3-dihydroxyphenylpropionate/2,3-dihydroxicinnamic acid 1,2-dioxygenase [Wickerhamomyces ciferrii]|uniref:2,3-dihydroxyphenylpropionate/2,3-dihydroxicinnamic acid 1,2-dioxygenase n=1 Tax=Wickerhamomyces ciferrii (strain ATCC 14091 / BCRC 22168 / CBS 111 / JCM 3599 / NBRC 0793 / NRRL Y-1031 F-60-10) TaxID=1206466 RepID=K0KUJ6_WICCF|nr:2,3-dihydroxyphenylpropionate/2,3-dihydroxicinnamic acid 1,2-dioxygenase [Wickerhamomyces ciferrii]CCH44858.1 2,3-dihydroxyphenylpropionate/2,3-dihydroxicinnamic acid 1,2-dioxygenase [Wickerhamomyces ciferrii]